MNKEDYLSWRNDPRTEEFLDHVLHEMDCLISDLVVSAGTNSLTDKYRTGVIQGLKFLADWQPVFDKEEITEDES